MNKISTVILMSTLMLFVGCAATGNHKLKRESEVSIDKKIIKNQTTKAEIRKMFGPAGEVINSPNNGEVWVYQFTSTSDIVNHIPVVNWLGSSTSITNKKLTVEFNENDVVVKYDMDIIDGGGERTGIFNL